MRMKMRMKRRRGRRRTEMGSAPADEVAEA
jgi:hypothetical protein